MRNGRWGFGLFVVVIASCLLGPAQALAGDANTVPPKLELSPGGEPKGLLGPKSSEFWESYESLAFFETAEPDRSWVYAKGSVASFECRLDGQPVYCSAQLRLCCNTSSNGVLLKALPDAKRKCPRGKHRSHHQKPCKRRPPRHQNPAEGRPERGAFWGEVLAPAGLTPGTHTITVIATDEDGVDPSPPSVTVFLDTTPPAAPELMKTPPKLSRDRKPEFRFTSTDDRAFPGESDHPGLYYPPFDASLRRIKPPGPTLHSSNPFGSYISIWRQRCTTIYECSAFARPVYEAGNGSLGFGIPELLRPGLYELGVQARDAVGNESPTTEYRFRILGPKAH